MKMNIRDIRVCYLLFMIAICMTGCEKGAAEEDFGMSYIYMPQATASGGTNNYYYVPSGDGTNTYNYKLDGERRKLQVILGVLRSGMTSNSGFSVGVKAMIESSRQTVATGSVIDGFVPDDNSFRLPTVVDVPTGKLSESFYLEIDYSVVMAEENSGKKLVLEVGLENPSQFELAEKNTSTTVIVDIDAMKAKINQ